MKVKVECAGEIHPMLIRFRVEWMSGHFYMFEINKLMYEKLKAENRLESELKKLIYDSIVIEVVDINE